MNKPLVYVAGPYTHPDPVLNTNRAIRVGMQLAESGLAAVEIPHLTMLAHLIEPRALEFWYAFDIDKLDHCQFVYRLSGASTGADKEVSYAFSNGIPIYYEEHGQLERLLSALKDWNRLIPTTQKDS